ncbi:methyl-accepting chemotaxis protein [Clostridium thailandense]|uniref:methyl-accepting chemotaxis protein n=1 Tax=Clostridium thailandense TaxID=2794346 RepID=UPI0039893F14
MNIIEKYGNDIIESLVNAIPLIQSILHMDSMFAVADKEKFIYYLPGKIIDAKVSPGVPIPHESGLYKCQQTGEKISLNLPKEVYGIPTKTCSIPIKDKSGSIIGAFSLGLSIDTQQTLHESAQTIAATAEEITAGMEELSSSAVQLARDLDLLQKSGENIVVEIEKTSEILQFVNQVATSSNLLGLNAAIEAARAGEQGRGFTVVAKEIRKMADNSSKSVKDIKEILQSIQNDISNMVNTLLDTAQLGENQASVTEEIAASMQQLTSITVEIERIAGII